MSICLAERDGERLVFYPLKEEFQKLLGDAEQRGPATAAKILVARADPCHPCNFSPLGQLIAESAALASGHHMPDKSPGVDAAQQQQQQQENRGRMLLAGRGLECCEFLGSYVTKEHCGLLQSQLDARTNADLTYEAATAAYEMEFPITEVGGDQVVLLANPDTALLALVNSMHCWSLEKHERGMQCPREAQGTCSCRLYSGRRPNVVLLKCLYKAADGSAVLAPLFFTARRVARHEELLWSYEDDGSGSYFATQLANMRQRLVLQAGELTSQEYYSLCLEQLREAHTEVQQALALQQPPRSAAAASAPAAAAAAAASKMPDLTTKAHRAIGRMQKLLHLQHTEVRLKCESLVDFALPLRAADAAGGQAVALPAVPARVTRGSGKQQQAHEQRRAVRSDPIVAVLAVGRALQQSVDEVQLLPAAAGSAGPVTSAAAAAAAVAAPAVSAAEEQYAADKMAALGQMHAALQSADACMNALRQQNAQLEEENARLRQQLAAVQQAAGHVPQFEG
ncbi:hypothetical protein OEZ86_006477 [Tetradesmus obliquus]|nr:hypothetical protein OEZ86_006477 [Tetradesmus obliquus]